MDIEIKLSREELAKILADYYGVTGESTVENVETFYDSCTNKVSYFLITVKDVEDIITFRNGASIELSFMDRPSRGKSGFHARLEEALQKQKEMYKDVPPKNSTKAQS